MFRRRGSGEVRQWKASTQRWIETVDRLTVPGSSTDPLGYGSGPAVPRPPPLEGSVRTMTRVESSDEAPPASLVGSLSVFALSDVLSMLSSTTQTGELQVVGDTVDGRVWLDRGKLSSAHVGTGVTIGQAVFDLACLTEGWFYFTSGPDLQRPATRSGRRGPDRGPPAGG